MGVILPSDAKEVVSRVQTDVRSELDNANPWLRSSFLRALSTALGNRIFGYYHSMSQAILESFPNSSTGKYRDMWAYVKNMLPIAASKTSGLATFTGTLGVTVGTGQVCTVGELEYTLQGDVLLVSMVRTVYFSPASLVRSGTVALCTTDDDHYFATGNLVAIAGVNEAGWDGDYTPITVAGARTFTFVVPDTLSSSTTGAITATVVGGSGTVESSTTGSSLNQDGGTSMTLQSPAVGVDDTAGAQYAGLVGGLNDEADNAYSDRITDRWRNPQTPFNPATIESTIKTINGNTRAWVHRIYPDIGAMTAYFVRDNDTSIIPSAAEVIEAKAAVVELTPANTDEGDTHVEACVAVPINISIGSLVPDSLTMRAAVEAQIRAYYRGALAEGEDHLLDGLKAELSQTYDSDVGVKLAAYTLSAPSVDQTIARGEIATEGTVTWT